MARSKNPSSKPKHRDDPKDFWIVAIEIDRVALAIAIAGAIAVVVMNAFAEQSSDFSEVLVRAVVTFAGLWLAAFALFWSLRSHLLAQLNAPPEVEEIEEPNPSEVEGEGSNSEEEPLHEDVA